MRVCITRRRFLVRRKAIVDIDQYVIDFAHRKSAEAAVGVPQTLTDAEEAPWVNVSGRPLLCGDAASLHIDCWKVSAPHSVKSID